MNKLGLTPRKSSQFEDFLENEEKVKELIEEKGSPLNLIFPEALRRNAKSFQEVMEKNSVSGRVFWAHKANRSKALVKEAYNCGIGVDVASLDELENAVQTGFDENKIEATGPKKRDFLDEVIERGITVNVDNLEELGYLGESGSKIEVLIRISGFNPKDRESISKDSRFGISADRKDEITEILTKYDNLDFKGFAFHLSTSDMRKRRIAISNIFDLHQSFSSKGLVGEILNIGGGFRTNYIEDRNEWEAYISALKDSVKNDGDLTWKDEKFGFYRDGDSVKGSNTFYDYFNSPSKHEYLDELLKSEIPGYDRVFADLLSDFMLELWVEPGRALLDQAGITLTEVMFSKESVKENNLIGVDANKFSLYSSEQEMMLDPVLISDQDAEEGSGFIVGNLCLESDVIYKHRTFFDQMPQNGDILAFINTAAYNMDFAENKAIHHSTAEKMAVTMENGKIKVTDDEDYSV